MAKVLVLTSGGIDSPAAAYLLMKNKGCEVGLVHFHNQTVQQAAVKNKVVRIAEALAKHTPKKSMQLYLVPFAPAQKEIIQHVEPDVRMIVYRRMMFRIAEAIARRDGYEYLATGDSLAQVASQTLENYVSIHAAATMPVLTPLLGEDKMVIKRVATEAGTLAISELPYEDCCSLLIAKHPVTKSRREAIEAAEEPLDTQGMAVAAASGAAAHSITA